ncbi:MAG: hypothetical protein ABIJ61_01170 [bacterium]
MNLLAIYYGEFNEIEQLYSRFHPGKMKLKIVVDVDDRIDDARETFLNLYRHATRLLPTLSQHSCCEEWEAAPLYLTREQGVSIKRLGETADFPHLLEHLIVDLQCLLSGMNTCSGVTCGWKKPETRFDLFIECDDPRIGVFAACFGTHLINNYLAGNPGEDDMGLILDLAQMIGQYPETREAVQSLAQSLSETIETINRGIQLLAELNFFSKPLGERDD